MALKRNSRLNKSSIISLVSRKGASLKSLFFRVKFLPARFGNTKTAIITSKKIERSAVKRNKIRRIIISCFQNISLSLPKNSNKKFLITIFPNSEVLSKKYKYSHLEKEVENIIQKIENFNFQQNNTKLKNFKKKKK